LWNLPLLDWYHVNNMATEFSSAPDVAQIDLTGLPEPIVQGIRSFVQTLRESLSPSASTLAKPERPPLRGRFRDQNVSIPKEDIDTAQREAWSGFSM
jgi:hypothetical protein